MKGFIVRQPWADLILSGKKTWEIRGSNCNIRGKVGIVSQGKWIGTIEIVDAIQLDHIVYCSNKSKHQVKSTEKMPYSKTWAWVLKNPTRFKTPKKYNHKSGCVIWVNL